ncbi:sigma-54 dependent transcriptional regulator [Desulfobacterota bacterium AH_259_B03_O07]|nr:sigma-54 dependent transcriptional regulator [Desulfobacterota bacterium AH_259_B03_O07]
MSALILIIDDEKLLCKQLEKALSREGYVVMSAYTGKDGIDISRRDNPNVVLLDLKLPDTDGLKVLNGILNLEPVPNTIMMTAHGNIEVAVSAIKMGAYDFIEKPFPIDKLKIMVRNALSAHDLKSSLSAVTKREQSKYELNSFISESKAVNEITKLLLKLSNTDPKMVLISGESGSGKGLAARILHFNGVRAQKPILELNCAAIPETLLETELFGHEAGAFTDAKKMKKGIFEIADGGTIFLDEIADMSLSIQAKLVKVVEERTFRRIGGTRDISVDVRIIAATNRTLKELVNKKLFREDLYHRLNVINFEMPPLRGRRDDIPKLTDYFIEYFNNELHKNICIVPDEVRQAFLDYRWPGNVRELRSAIERAVLLSEGERLNPNYVKLEEQSENDVRIYEDEEKIVVEMPLQDMTLSKIEERVIREALNVNDWNQTRTAEKLGVTREVLRYRMKKMGLLE